MIAFRPGFGEGQPRLLVIGAHADDIEIGCGGVLIRLIAAHPSMVLRWVVLSGADKRKMEARRSAELYSAGVAESALQFETFRDGRFPFEAPNIKDLFDGSLKAFEPDLILTHWARDAHQDHRVVSELTWQTFRNNAILEYEIPKYDGDMGRPNGFVEIDRETLDLKINRLLDCFESQSKKQWFDDGTFRGLARIRGMECASTTGYAEAFHVRKLNLF